MRSRRPWVFRLTSMFGVAVLLLVVACSETKGRGGGDACATGCPPDQSCVSGACVLTCASGLTACGGACVELATAATDCGACGIRCDAGQVCTAGRCTTPCALGQTPCAGTCVDLATNASNCGACGTACAAGTICTSGACIVAPEDHDIFAQDAVLRDARALLASAPYVAGATYAWTLTAGTASGTIVGGANSQVVEYSVGSTLGTYTLSVDVTPPAPTTATMSRALVEGTATHARALTVVGGWVRDDTSPAPILGAGTLLPTGRVLVAGGGAGNGSAASVKTAQIYDPATNTWASAADLPTASSGPRIALPDGRVALIGGAEWIGQPQCHDTTDLYDPTADVWTSGARRSIARCEYASALLRDGRIFVTGGNRVVDPTSGAYASVYSSEIYDPVADTWTSAADLPAAFPPGAFTSVTLDDGRVLIVSTWHTPSDPAVYVLYDPRVDGWSRTAQVPVLLGTHNMTVLATGEVLVVGWSYITGGIEGIALAYDPVHDTWNARALPATPRAAHSATLLPDGRVLIAGGQDLDGRMLASAELYDPATDTWTAASSLQSARCYHSATLLADGNVVVIDGSAGGSPLGSAERYDVKANVWTYAGRAATSGIASHTATLLRNGMLLRAGGFEFGSNGHENAVASAFLYDAPSRSWTATGNLVDARYGHSADVLPDGRVLVAGGMTVNLATAPNLASTELYDPATRSWTVGPPLPRARARHASVVLPDGRILVIGGYGADFYDVTGETDVYDPATNGWTSVAPLPGPRTGHTATVAPEGDVVVIGGSTALGADTGPVQRYAPAAGTWTAGAPMSTTRSGHTATLLGDGRILVVGGITGGGGTVTASAEIYDPRTDTWTAAASLAAARWAHTATLLATGEVLVVGGMQGNWDTAALTSAEVYNAATDTWRGAGDLAYHRVNHTTTELPDGLVVVIGGGGDLGWYMAGPPEFWRP